MWSWDGLWLCCLSARPVPSWPPGGTADPAAGCRAPGPAPAYPHLHCPSPGPAAGSVLEPLPQGGLSPPPGTDCKAKMFYFFYFKMLQLNELLFRSLPLFIQKYCATDTVEKVQMASPAGEIHRVPRRHGPGPVPIHHQWLPKAYIPGDRFFRH